MKSKLIKGLEDYLRETPPEELKKDWEELEKYNQYGPEMEECLERGRKSCLRLMHEQDDPLYLEKRQKVEEIISEILKKSKILEEVEYLVEYRNDNRFANILQDVITDIIDQITPLIRDGKGSDKEIG